MFSPLDSKISSYRLNSKHPTASDILDEVAEELVNALPHGSGIDCDWRIEHKEGLKFDCHNYWHAMDQNGYYCGYVAFTVKIDLLDLQSFDIEVCQSDIDNITADYDIDEKTATEEELEDWNENNPCPYLDDLDEVLYEDIRFGLEHYFMHHTIKYAVNAYPELIKRELAKALPEISKIDVK